jgi:hypothetical protein
MHKTGQRKANAFVARARPPAKASTLQAPGLGFRAHILEMQL